MELTTHELMNLETLVSMRIQDSKDFAKKYPNSAEIHMEFVPMYEELAGKLQDELNTRFNAMTRANNGALFSLKAK